jgi:hypothetical protein
MNESIATESRGWKAVYTIVERPGGEKKKWVRIGNAFVNRDQSINVKLDAVPVNGAIHIRDIDEEEIERSRQWREQRALRSAASVGGGA